MSPGASVTSGKVAAGRTRLGRRGLPKRYLAPRRGRPCRPALTAADRPCRLFVMIPNKNHIQTVATAPPAGARWTGLRGLLRARGGRLTPQRIAIYEAVVGHTTHPSVEMVHAAVRARFPGVSRATVYATLD